MLLLFFQFKKTQVTTTRVQTTFCLFAFERWKEGSQSE